VPARVPAERRGRAPGPTPGLRALTLHVTPGMVLLNHGEPLQDVHQRPTGAARANVYAHSPIWHAGQNQLAVKAETWARQVLIPWQQAAAITLVVKLPADTATDDHRTVIRDLTDAQQRLDSGDCKGSVRASRDAIEVLRSMHTEHLNPKKTLRTLDEREAARLDAKHKLIQALLTTSQRPTPIPASARSPGHASTPCSPSPPQRQSLNDSSPPLSPRSLSPGPHTQRARRAPQVIGGLPADRPHQVTECVHPGDHDSALVCKRPS
jgi:hypothetical protein